MVHNLSIWLQGPLDQGGVEALQALIQDFRQQLGVELQLEECTEISRAPLQQTRVYTRKQQQQLVQCSLMDEQPAHELVLQLSAPPTDQTVAALRRKIKRTLCLPVEIAVRPVPLHRLQRAGALLPAPARDIRATAGGRERSDPTSADEIFVQSYNDLEFTPSKTGRWFAQGLAAERGLASYSTIDRSRIKPRRRGPRGGRLFTAATALLLLLGTSTVTPARVGAWLSQGLDRVQQVLKSSAPERSSRSVYYTRR